MLSYFGEYLGLTHLMALSQQAESDLPQAYGTLGYEPYVNTLFGVPVTIVPGGVKVNVLLTYANEPADGTAQKRHNLNVQTGIVSSALENGVPEQMFSSPTKPVQGVSAVAALQIAMSEGQRIYDITTANEAQALPNLHLQAQSMTEIEQALAAGDEVIAHTDPISVPGWTGEGYIILDPLSGAGAYKITGGSNGDFTQPANADQPLLFAASVDPDSFEILFDVIKDIFFWLADGVKALSHASEVLDILDYLTSLHTLYQACNGPLFSMAVASFTLLTAAWVVYPALYLSLGPLLLASLTGIIVLYLAIQAWQYECSLQADGEKRKPTDFA